MLTAAHVSKQYETVRGPVSILSDVSMEVTRGDSVAIMGPSGCGKSTLLYLLGALERPTSGTITLDGRDPYELNDADQSAFRNQQVGFIFQDHLLLPQLSALDNVLAPTLVSRNGEADHARVARGRALLDAVGLSSRVEHRPGELSGGERQRVAIARALIQQPSLVLCDEPTGNLDRASADAVAELLVSMQQQHDIMLVVVTHSPDLASRFARKYELSNRTLVPA